MKILKKEFGNGLTSMETGFTTNYVDLEHHVTGPVNPLHSTKGHEKLLEKLS